MTTGIKEKEDEAPENEKSEDAFDKAIETYKWWNNLSRLDAQDPIIISCFKLGLRLIGILFLLAISPLIILGLIIGISEAF